MSSTPNFISSQMQVFGSGGLVIATSAIIRSDTTGRAHDQIIGIAGSTDTVGFDVAVVASAAEKRIRDAVVAAAAHECLGLHC